MAKKKNTPFVLMVLDGWGIGKKGSGNAIELAKTPNIDSYSKECAYTELQASGKFVGLPNDQDGNSEAGHMNIGAGRIVEQDSVVISRAISDGTFFKNPAFIQALKHVKKYNSSVHLMGLLSDGQSAHSHPDHLVALIAYFRRKNVRKVYLHLFTDGRDSHQYEALKLIKKYHMLFHGYCTIATISGRAYAMDRKKDWKNTEKAYNAMVLGESEFTSSSAENAIIHAYNRGETDEFIEPTVIVKNKKPIATISSKDSVIFFNLRSDRARQMAKPFVQENFEKVNAHSFKRKKKLEHLYFCAMTDFGPDLGTILTAFPSRDLVDTLPMVLRNYKQLYIAESEKYAHITYFFNGGYDAPVGGEERVQIPSPDALSYIKNPKMSLDSITNTVIESIERGSHEFIAMNVSNADMIAHTGSLEATIAAVEYIDVCIKQIVSAVLKKQGVVCITADHGNAEELLNEESGEIDTEHSKSKVPFIIVKEGKKYSLRSQGALCDVAPTILQILGITQPKAMTGKSLIKK